MAGLRIGIAGAGIGGLAAAALLARDGHWVSVFDRFETPRPVGSGLVVQPVGLAVLEAAGAAAAALSLGARIGRMQGWEAATGARVLDVAYARNGDGRFGLAIHRASLFSALLEAALSAGAVLQAGRHVTGVRADPDGRPRLAFADGAAAGPLDLVIDAAGARSALSPLVARPLPYGAIWGTVAWPPRTTLPADRLTQRYRRASRMAGVLPIGTLPGDPTPRAAIFWSLPADGHKAWCAAPLEGWKAEARAFWPEFGRFVEAIERHDDMTMARYGHGTLPRPYATRLVHIGDAAHRSSPQLGQGANMALLDAAALAQALRLHGAEEAPAAYARLRRWHVRLYQGMSWAFTPQYQSDSRILPILRDRILAPLSRMPPTPAILTRLVCGDLIPPIRGAPRDLPP